MRLIDADALHESLKAKQKWVVRCEGKHNEGYTYDQVHFAIDDAPTIDPVKHGRWETIGESFPENIYMACSVCGVQYTKPERPWNYCPNCGAKMDKENRK